MTAIETLKQWFSNLKKPTQEQFWAWLDSFWHKSEKIPMASVEGLDKLVEGTASAEQLSNHLNDTQAHKVLFDKKVDKVEGKELSSNDFTNEYKEKLDTLQPTDTSKLLPKGGYEGTGKELKDAIDSLQTKMGQVETTLSVDDTDFDTLQEIATQVKSNKNLQTLLTKKVDKEDGKGLSTNDFTTTLKEKLEGISPFFGKFLSHNLIKGNTKNLPERESKSTYDFLLDGHMEKGEYLLSYTGYRLGDEMSIKMIDVTGEKEVVVTLLYEETEFGLGRTTYYYLLKNEIDVNTGNPPYSYYVNNIKVEFGKDKFVRNLQLRRFGPYPVWEANNSLYTSYGLELFHSDNTIEIGRCNLVNTNGNNREFYVYYEENTLFSVAKTGSNDEGKIIFKCTNGEIEGTPEITGKVGSRAEGICTGGKVYITVHNRE
ncbi:hypothetical protein HMPREF1977_1587 [Capnocytophaga ochracea F0287]|uniref:Uncharacterized protein n=1 Tax=Capnocytophaga ochracea F0287 TaxID=873517 RepID=E4MT77_CAPOC|nr:hypothetical protein [Capnocytophaga ochracea]EFS97097.1 hypothetical protein HMPREF1977_1587 [Capnocytophaga ochracea F0287]EJF45154.1 hypothetical protein HMPREF1319_0056 [Capnocytophaga ochracea str. Holt 25]UEB42354.1 hypothetical protein LK419_05935 [Capnocytophaga ochracea]